MREMKVERLSWRLISWWSGLKGDQGWLLWIRLKVDQYPNGPEGKREGKRLVVTIRHASMKASNSSQGIRWINIMDTALRIRTNSKWNYSKLFETTLEVELNWPVSNGSSGKPLEALGFEICWRSSEADYKQSQAICRSQHSMAKCREALGSQTSQI